MTARTSVETASPLIPPHAELDDLRAAAAACRACDLWQRGTQTVFGMGPSSAKIILVGEQPGNDEDLAGAPFVGPAGKLLDRALDESGIDRRDAYVTNAVKHFKWIERGKRRIHQKPSAREIRACKPWLEAEIAALRPRAIVLLGATAAQAMLGPSFRVTQHRGEIIEALDGASYMATVHPSSILRAPDDAARKSEMAAFVRDLDGLARWLGNNGSA